MATDPETIEELRHQIATSLASLAVPDLPHEAEGLGLSAGRAEEAQLGRYPYVRARVDGLGLEQLLAVADAIIARGEPTSVLVRACEFARLADGSTVFNLRARDALFEELLLLPGIPGKLSWQDFFSRTWRLTDLPSTDPRYSDAAGDVAQHMDRNDDWDAGYAFRTYFKVNTLPDARLVHLLEQFLHPVVRKPEDVGRFRAVIERHLGPLGFVVVQRGDLGGYPLWKIVRGTAAAKDTEAGSPRRSLATEVEVLKEGLTSMFDGFNHQEMDRGEYQRIRRLVLAHPGIAVPEFLRRARTPAEAFSLLPGERALQDALNPILDELEGSELGFSADLEFKERLGQGGFGVVWRATHRLLNVDFALKVLHPAFDDGNPAHSERFLREAHILFRLSHPNIVRVFDVGLFGGRPGIRMELVEGKSLDKVLAAHGAWAPPKARVFTEKLLQALHHAHEDVKVIHRDLKPSNIMVATGERLKLLDFGLGVFVEGELVSRLTRPSQGVAGGRYSAPELEVTPTLLDVRTDLYSVGALWFTLLTGSAPGLGDPGSVLRRIPGVTDSYARTVLGLLEPIDRRTVTAQAALEALREIR